MPSDFPRLEYEAVHQRVSSARGGDVNYHHYAGAWNAVSYRFRGAVDSGDSFIESLRTHGTAPQPPERYRQERLIFEFFSSGFSVFEALFFALYAIGLFLGRSEFALATPRDQQLVTPARTRDAYQKAFGNDPIIPVIANAFSDPGFQSFREIRNVLTHRAAPGRLIYASLGSDDAPPAEWKLNRLPLNEALVTGSRGELARLTKTFAAAAESFVTSNLK